MESKKRIVLQPSYMKSFSCIGSACEDSCCIGWTVWLDKSTYQSYKKNQNKILKPIFARMTNRNRSTTNDADYGKIKMEEDGRCPFLNEKNLCKVYTEIGENHLSDTCTLYPRNTSKIDSKFERSATMSCPEAVRIGLLNPEGIAFEQVEESVNAGILADKGLQTEGREYINKAERYFWDIRLFSLSLLQNRNYNLGDRLILLGMAYNKIENLIQKNQVQDIPIMLEEMDQTIVSGVMKDDLEKVLTNIEVQMGIAQGLTDEDVVKDVQSQRYLDCLQEVLLGIRYAKCGTPQELSTIYEENYKLYVAPYLEEKGYILENYLVNEYFKEVMPFGKYKTIWDSYIYLCLLYGMLKFHMIGMGGYHKGLNDDLMIKLIQSYSKVVTHSPVYIQGVIKLIKDHEYDSLAYMAGLVKN